MANTIKIKRSAVSGKVPTTAQLELGELAVNTHDGKLYTKKDDGTAAVVQIGDAASTADALSTARTIALGGDVSGSTSFDGSANVTITATVADDSHNHVISNVDGLQTALDAKAPLASPALTGTPTAPTAAAGTNTTQVATTAFVSTAVANVIDSAPAALDTLNELAAALGDDANFSTTVTNSIATKLPLSGGQMTGNITFSSTQTVDGRDLSVDGAKLDGIESGAEVNVATNLAQGTRTTTTVPVTSSTGTDATLTAATTSLAGVMTAADKSKLDGIASGATNVTNNNQLTNGAGYITSSGSISGNAATATTLQTARTINGVSFNGSGNITVEAYIENDDSSNATRYLTFVDNSTASFKRLNEDSSLTYNPSSNVLSAGTFSGALSGNASTATTLQTARTINGTSFNGSANITITANTPNTLSRGSYLTGSNFNGGAATTWAVDATSANTANKVVARDGNGDFSGRYIYSSYFNNSHSQTTRNSDTEFYSGTGGWLYKNTASGMRSSLDVPTRTGGDASGTWGISVTGNAGTATTLATSRTIALGGDLSGSASFNGGSNITITAAVADDSHNHVVSNIDGLQTTLNDKASLTSAQTFTLAQRGQVDALSSASTITPNFANSNNFSISLSTNTTIANPSNLVAGQSGAIAITYNGGYTVAFGSYWKFPGGTAPTATSTSGKTDVLVYYVESSTRISAQLILNTGG